jgi:hypothetical protein
MPVHWVLFLEQVPASKQKLVVLQHEKEYIKVWVSSGCRPSPDNFKFFGVQLNSRSAFSLRVDGGKGEIQLTFIFMWHWKAEACLRANQHCKESHREIRNFILIGNRLQYTNTVTSSINNKVGDMFYDQSHSIHAHCILTRLLIWHHLV